MFAPADTHRCYAHPPLSKGRLGEGGALSMCSIRLQKRYDYDILIVLKSNNSKLTIQSQQFKVNNSKSTIQSHKIKINKIYSNLWYKNL